jgi:hypothetical protein
MKFLNSKADLLSPNTVITGGITSERPSNPAQFQLYWDSSLDKLIIMPAESQVQWKDAMGNNV